MGKEDGWITIGTKLETKQFDKQIEYVKNRMEEIEDLLKRADKGEQVGDVLKLEAEYEKLGNTLLSLEQKKKKALDAALETTEIVQNVNEINDKLKQVDNSFEDIEATTKEIKENTNFLNKSMVSIIKKVGKWGLAIFGIRSAYNFIRQSMSTLSQYDEQLATDMEYIRYIIASTLEPVIKVIVELVYKLLSLLNAVWSRLFGVSLFSANLAKNFKNAKNSANAMKKSLAGFDEMNILNSDGSTGITLSPSFDPSKADKDINKWLDNLIAKVKNFGQSILNLIPNYLKEGISLLWHGFFDEIAGIILIIKGLFTGSMEDINAGLGAFAKGFTEILQGLVTIASGVVNSIISFFGRIGAGLWNGLKQGARDVFNGIKSLFSQLPNWFKALVKGIVNGAISMINGLIIGLNAILLPLRAVILAIGKVMGKNWTLQTVSIPKIPRLAKGGIVNMPSRGVPVGGAIAGERGQEGVIPLTDSQQMELLGEAIGRHINLSATIPVYAYNRQVAREIRKIELQSNFAMNR